MAKKKKKAEPTSKEKAAAVIGRMAEKCSTFETRARRVLIVGEWELAYVQAFVVREVLWEMAAARGKLSVLEAVLDEKAKRDEAKELTRGW